MIISVDSKVLNIFIWKSLNFLKKWTLNRKLCAIERSKDLQWDRWSNVDICPDHFNWSRKIFAGRRFHNFAMTPKNKLPMYCEVLLPVLWDILVLCENIRTEGTREGPYRTMPGNQHCRGVQESHKWAWSINSKAVCKFYSNLGLLYVVQNITKIKWF